MKLASVIAAFATVCCGAALVVWMRETASRAEPGAVGPLESNATGDAAAPKRVDVPGDGATPAGPSKLVLTGGERDDQPAADRPAASASEASLSGGLRWPATPALRSGARQGSPGASAAGTPEVEAKLAFRALYYVGVDPEAERTWLTAINDPNLPPGVRSDLIEDLNDEGYTDNSNPTKADLPLIRARLELIERIAPYAMDRVNADAFKEAYKDLLEMYVRLTRT